jgi:hypothetical protein
MTTFQDLLEELAASSLEKQWALEDLIGGLDWFIDLDKGILELGDSYRFPIQVLGTESEDAGTWLWAWANDASGIPINLLSGANRLKKMGEAEDIRELYQAEISLDQISGTQLALVAVGILGLTGYYRGPYDMGAVFVLLETDPAEIRPQPDVVRMVNVFAQLVGALHLNHKRAFSAYARQKGLTVEPTSTGLYARSTQGSAIMADFDVLGRLTNLQTIVTPEKTG